MEIYPLSKLKKIAVAAVLFSLTLSLITSCENNTGEESHFQVTKDTSFLDDSNYVFKNISTTKNLDFVDRKSETDKSIFIKYSDSTCKKPLKLFSKNDLALLLDLFLPADYGVDYAVNEMWGHFVSKQHMIGALQPIIVSIGAVDDYSALRLIVLNKNRKPVSYLDLDEQLSFIPNSNDYQTKSYSTFQKNEILSYQVVKHYYLKKNGTKDVVVDSTFFKSIIDAKGKISTKQIAKVHYTKAFKINY